MTQGPAMRNRGLSRPTSKPQSFIAPHLRLAPQHRHPGESRDPFCSCHPKSKWVPAFAGMTIAGVSSRHRLFRKPRRLAIGFLLARRANEADEQRMPVARRRREFRMELAREKPRMVGELDHLDEEIVHRLAGDDETEIFELLPIA